MNRLTLILVLSINSFFCDAASVPVREIIFCLYTTHRFHKMVSYYEKVSQEEHYAKDIGLSGLFHGMFAAGVGQIVVDSQTLQKAQLLLSEFAKNEAFVAICTSSIEELCTEESAKRVRLLAQSNLVCAMKWAGFPIAIPEDDAHTIFVENPDREKAKQLLELNRHVSNDPEAAATMRGALIAGYFLMQEIDRDIVRATFPKTLECVSN